jgi:hypothetical protein
MKNTSILPKHSKKTDELFHVRLVDPLAQAVLDPNEYHHWLSSAIAIQDAIYQIDSYYESHRTLSLPNEQPMWECVDSRIRGSNGSSSFAVWRSFSDLRRYGQVEARIHSFDLIDAREFADIASLKTADVRIARALIWSYLATPSQSLVDFWTTFDECGELIEDLADIKEDGRDWNFNFWLYTYMAKGNVTQSLIGASQTLRNRLAALEEAYSKLPNVDRDACGGALRQTLRAGAATLKNSGIVFDRLAHGSVWRYGQEREALNVVA